MADLKKLLVHVPSNLCDGFKNKYVNGTEETRNKSYDGKIVFLEKTQEIFTKGKIYSTSVIDFSSLQQLVSSLQGLVGNELPEGVTSTNIIDYIGEVKKELIGKESDDLTKDTIYGAKDYGIKAAYETKLELIGLDSDKIPEAKTIYGAYNSAISYLIGSSYDLSSYETIYGTRAYAREILPSVTASTGIKVSYSTLYGKTTYTVTNTGVTGVDEEYKYGIGLYQTLDGLVNVNVNIGKVASRDNNVVIGDTVYKAIDSTKTDLIGKSSDASTANTIYGAKKYADEAASKVAAQIPTLSAGNGISLEPSTLDGHPNIKISTSARVFYYQGNKTTVSALPSTGNKGDVWSVGTENAEGSTLYVWDGDEWINIGGPNGVTDVKTTSSHGVALAKNQGGEVYVNVIPGEIKENNGSVVTGGAVYTAMQGLINGLTAHTVTSSNDWGPIGTYVGVSVTTEKGQVSAVSTYMGSDFDTLRLNADKAIKEIESDSAYLSVTNSWGKNDGPTYCRLDLDKDALSTYVIDRIGENTKTGTSAYVNVSVTTSKGNVSEVTVAPTEDLKLAYSYAMSSVQWIREPIASWSYFKIEEGDENPTYGYKGKGFNINLNETNVVNLVKNKLDLSSSKTAYSTDHNPTAPYYVKVGVTTHNGKVQDVIVHNSQQFTTNMSKVESLNNVVNKIESKDSFLNITKSDSDYEYTAYYEFDLDEDAIFNYVADHIWEEYSA